VIAAQIAWPRRALGAVERVNGRSTDIVCCWRWWISQSGTQKSVVRCERPPASKRQGLELAPRRSCYAQPVNIETSPLGRELRT
jgi:hypothetical protein